MKQKMQMVAQPLNEQNNIEQSDLDIIKDLLGNENVIKWVALNGAENINQKIPLKEELTTNANSLVFMDLENVSALVTNAQVKAKPYAIYSIEKLMQIGRILGKDARLCIFKENYPAVIEESVKKTCVVLAPRVNED